MIWWLFFWLPDTGGSTPPPTPEPLLTIRRDGITLSGALPTIVRRSS